MTELWRIEGVKKIIFVHSLKNNNGFPMSSTLFERR
jgi:hypothetical protein